MATNITAAPPGVATPDRVETRLGTLNFRDGVPDAATTQKLYDELDYIRAVDAFINAYPGLSPICASHRIHRRRHQRQRVRRVFGPDGRHIDFSDANADTYYLWGYLDLTKGPLVIEVPPGMLGLFDDMWWHWIGDFGFPGPDRGEGGKYLMLPPGYTGEVPEGGYSVYSSRTYHASRLGRAFLENNDPKPVDDNVKKNFKVYPYVPGSQGSSIGKYLTEPAAWRH